MPALLVAVLRSLGIDLVELAINYLEKKGVIPSPVAVAARVIHDTKSYHDFSDFPSNVRNGGTAPN